MVFSIIFFALTILLNFVEVVFSGSTLNPSNSFDYKLAFGIFKFPGFINWEGISIVYDFLPILIFQLLFAVSYLFYLANWIFKLDLKKIWMKEHINIIIVVLMLISLLGSLMAVEISIQLNAISPTEITSSLKISELGLGLLFGLLVISIIFIDYVISIKFYEKKL
jgi:hypothetical protein